MLEAARKGRACYRSTTPHSNHLGIKCVSKTRNLGILESYYSTDAVYYLGLICNFLCVGSGHILLPNGLTANVPFHCRNAAGEKKEKKERNATGFYLTL
jgi:hypothetical protein